ncbi:MAG: NfeD family protein [Bacilli bacterium]|nr:NfeD family protein [Bacilli bacterium]
MIWLLLIAMFLIIESLTLNLVTIWFAFGSLCAFITTYFTDNILLQSIVFVGTTALSLIFTKPLFDKYIKKNIEKTNIDMIIGKTGVVTKNIKPNENGRVKVAGKSWMATAKEEIKEGEEVEILKIEGVKIIVKRKES